LAAQAALIAGMTWGGVAIGTVLFNFDVSLVNVFWASFSAWLLGLVYGYFALAAQSLKGKRTFGAAAGAGFLALTYFFNLVADQVGALEFLKYLSPFYYFNVQNILLTGANITNFAVLALCAVAFYIVAYVKFMNRDTGT
jgi:ABC-2 type transport system permease protein